MNKGANAQEYTPKLSVIVPVYNVVDFLDECVQSILAQDYPNLEIILVDDGSTDGSGEKCDKYALESTRVFVFHSSHGGVSRTRNIGVSHITGDFFTFVDSDDLLAKDYFSTLLQPMITNEEIDIVCGAATGIDMITYLIDKGTSQPLIDYIDRQYLSPNDVMIKVYKEPKMIDCVWGKIYRTNIINKIHEEIFDDDIPYAEDKLATYRMCLVARRIYNLPYTGYYYRARIGSICHSVSNDNVNKYHLLVLQYVIFTGRLSFDVILYLAELYVYKCFIISRSIFSLLNEDGVIKENKYIYYVQYQTQRILRQYLLKNTSNGRCCSLIYPFLLRDSGVRSLKNKKIYIYGAGVNAHKVYQLLNQYNINCRGFVVSSRETINRDNTKYIEQVVHEDLENIIIVMGMRVELNISILMDIIKYKFKRIMMW